MLLAGYNRIPSYSCFLCHGFLGLWYRLSFDWLTRCLFRNSPIRFLIHFGLRFLSHHCSLTFFSWLIWSWRACLACSASETRSGSLPSNKSSSIQGRSPFEWATWHRADSQSPAGTGTYILASESYSSKAAPSHCSPLSICGIRKVQVSNNRLLSQINFHGVPPPTFCAHILHSNTHFLNFPFIFLNFIFLQSFCLFAFLQSIFIFHRFKFIFFCIFQRLCRKSLTHMRNWCMNWWSSGARVWPQPCRQQKRKQLIFFALTAW